MRKGIHIAAIFLVLVSCNEGIKYPDPPNNLIPREKMIHVITELSQLEAYIQDTYPGVNRYHKTMLNSVDSLFVVEGITHEQFEASMDYYSSDQNDMAKMYDEAIQRLSRELGELQDN